MRSRSVADLIEVNVGRLQQRVVTLLLGVIRELTLRQSGGYPHQQVCVHCIAASLKAYVGRLDGFAGDACIVQTDIALPDRIQLRSVDSDLRIQCAGHRRVGIGSARQFGERNLRCVNVRHDGTGGRVRPLMQPRLDTEIYVALLRRLKITIL